MKKSILAEYTEKLKESQARLKELNQRGAKVLSRYDIEVASGGDAEAALRTAQYLVRNHISYYKEKITELKKKPTQLELL